MRTIRDCPVCVVGGAGFLGSHLVNHLIDDRGCSVLVIDNLCAGSIDFIHDKATFWHHDITGSEDELRRRLKVHGTKFVFNYAAWPYIPDSFARPLQVFNVNAFGALKVINAAQEAGCEAILQVSSAEIYGSGSLVRMNEGYYGKEDQKIPEDGQVFPHSSYGAAKAAIDAMCQVRWREAKTPVIALRQFNAVGERETHSYIVPEIISQLSKQIRRLEPHEREYTATVKLGNNSFRDFLYAGDAVRIAVELLERGDFGQVYNLGSETGIKMYDLAKLIGEVMGFADVKVEKDESRVRPWEIWSLLSSNEKIYSVVDRRALVPLEKALRQTIEWYESNGRKWCWEK